MKFFVRIAVLVFSVLTITLAVFWLHRHQGAVTLDWMGYQIAAPLHVLGGIVLVLLLAMALITYLLTGFVSSLRQRRLQRQLGKKDSGMDAMTRAMVLLAAGDHKNASRYVEKSARQLGHTPLVSMLRASIAKREGNKQVFEREIAQMLMAPSTQPLAAITLAAEHKTSGRLEEAASVIEQAALKGTLERGTAHVLLDIYHRQKRWQEMESLLARMLKSHLVDKDEAHRIRAIMHYLQAQDMTNISSALLHIETAHHEDAAFVPAAVELCRKLDHKQQKRVLAIMKKSWKKQPHPDLARVFFLKMQGEQDRAIISPAKAVAHQAPGHIESLLLLAETSLRARDWDQARNYLKAALAKDEQVRIYQMFATLEQEATGDRESVMGWLSKAAHAKPSPTWNCTSCGTAHAEWKAVCNTCDSFAQIVWNRPMPARAALPIDRLLSA